MSTRLSVIIPLYNAQNNIVQLINQIEKSASSIYSNLFEIIMINDGSIDNTNEKCIDICKRFSNIVYINKDNQGVSQARNCGINIARGDYLTFCDADDFVTDDYINHIFHNISMNTDCDILVFSYFTSGDGISLNKKEFGRIKTNTNRNCFLMRMLLDETFGGFVWNKVYRRQSIDNILFDPDLEICEDLVFNYLIYRENYNIKVVCSNHPVYIYMDNICSSSRNICNLFANDGTYKYEKALISIYNHEVDFENKQALKSKLFMLAVSTSIDNYIARVLPQQDVVSLNRVMNNCVNSFFCCKYIGIIKKIKFFLFYKLPFLKKYTVKKR